MTITIAKVSNIDRSAPLAVDETGGMDTLLEILRNKKDATGEFPVIITMVTTATGEQQALVAVDTETTAQPAERDAGPFLRRALSRTKAAISKAVKTVREAVKWLFSDVPSLNPRLITRFRNRFYGYQGRHHVQRTWFGVQRSTFASVSITRERHSRAQQTSNTKEGALSSYFQLPEYWISHMASMIEVIRDEHNFLHPSVGRHASGPAYLG